MGRSRQTAGRERHGGRPLSWVVSEMLWGSGPTDGWVPSNQKEWGFGKLPRGISKGMGAEGEAWEREGETVAKAGRAAGDKYQEATFAHKSAGYYPGRALAHEP